MLLLFFREDFTDELPENTFIKSYFQLKLLSILKELFMNYNQKIDCLNMNILIFVKQTDVWMKKTFSKRIDSH